MKIIIRGNIPSTNRRAIGYKNGRPFVFKQKQAEIEDIIYQIEQQQTREFDKCIYIRYIFYFPDRRKRDIDNRIKTLNDCLEEAGVIKDDSLIVKMCAEKFVDKEKGHLTIIEIQEV